MGKKRRYGWVKDKSDSRDIRYSVCREVALPPVIDLRPKMPDCYDQGQTGSCSGNATAGAIHYDRILQALPVWTPSRLFIYYNTRLIEGTTSEDAGGTIRDSVKSVAKYGTCREDIYWPYIEEKFADKPPAMAYQEAAKHTAIQYLRIDNSNISELKQCLVAGFPVIFGMSVYESFESDDVAKTGKVPLPGKGEQRQGGHALLLCGYSDPLSAFIVRNSWGTTWGLSGYCYIPYAYLTDLSLASDFWTIRRVAA